MNLTEFLLAHIDEEAAVAREAAVLPAGIGAAVVDGFSVAPAKDCPSATPEPSGRWGWDGGPVNNDDPEVRELRAAFGQEPRAGMEMRPYRISDGGAWDESDEVGSYVFAEIRPDAQGVASHIARHDPARVLAECAAKRQILTLHAAHPEPQRMVYGTILACSTCGSVDDSPVEWPCETVRALASIYADHPDFDPAWLP